MIEYATEYVTQGEHYFRLLVFVAGVLLGAGIGAYAAQLWDRRTPSE